MCEWCIAEDIPGRDGCCEFWQHGSCLCPLPPCSRPCPDPSLCPVKTQFFKILDSFSDGD